MSKVKRTSSAGYFASYCTIVLARGFLFVRPTASYFLMSDQITISLPPEFAGAPKEHLDALCKGAFEMTLDEVVAELLRDALASATQ